MRLVDADALAMKLRHMGYMDENEEVQEVIDRFAEECDGDLISRQDAIDAVDDVLMEDESYKVWLKIAIRNAPSVQQERKNGKWIRITQGAIPEKYICPFCHREVEIYGVEELLPIRYPFCHCGADMRGEEDE